MTPPVKPILVNIGPLAIHWYGVLIVTGIILGANVAAYLAQRAKSSEHAEEHVWDMLLFAVVMGIIGARLYHVISEPTGGMRGWSYYKDNPLEMLFIWEGGLGIYGAIIGGALGVLIYTKIAHLNPLEWLDYAAPGMAIGQSIGRWGNYINRELYGPPTTLPWGLHIPAERRIPPYNDMTVYPPNTLFHPTFLYESMAAFALCLLLIWISTRYRDRLKKGDILISYLIGYATIRFFTEFLRPDAWMMGSLATAQVIALVLFVGGVLTLVIRHTTPAQRSTS